MEETSGEESWALVPYPEKQVAGRIAEDAITTTNDVYNSSSRRGITDVITFGANVFSEAYRRAASDMFQYMNNGYAVILDKNNQAINYMLTIQDEINRRTNYELNGLAMTLSNRVETTVGEVTKAVRNISTADQAIINSLYQQNMNSAHICKSEISVIEEEFTVHFNFDRNF